MAELLAEYLRTYSLLVLDNCEHLLDACASLAARLLSTCPSLRVLATSREPLGVRGERIYRVEPLPLPDGDGDRGDAVRLFLERAAATGWQPDTSEQTLSTIAAICRELDGLPLALELAAARTQVLSVDEIAARLDDRFRFLRSWRGSHEPRHETLGATMAWSYDLLTEDERTLLARLSVFAGGFTLATAAIVCLDEDKDATLELLSRLVQASLVLVDSTGSESRYHMLETVRRYAAERLEQSGEARATRDRHAECFAGDPKEVARFWPAEGWGAKLFLRTAVDLDNLRAALDWASETESPLELPLAIKYQRADAVLPAEGRARLTHALASRAPSSPQLRARALAAAGGLARIQGDMEAASRDLNDSLRLYRATGDYECEIVVLARLEEVAIETGAEVDVLRVAGDSERLARRMGDPVMLSAALTRRAIRAVAVGDRNAARELLDESLEVLGTARGAPSSRAELSVAYRAGDAHTLRAVLELLDGDLERALTETQAGLDAFSEIGEDYAGRWDSVDVLAAVLAHAGDLETAVRLAAAVRRHRETRGEQIPWVLASVREETHGGIERALLEPDLAAAAAEGRGLSLREAIATALSAASRIAAP
jgi:predicted ATPase